MLFDNPKIRQLCLRYNDEPDFAVPEIVRLARSPFLTGERMGIEHIFQTLPDAVQKNWRSRFISTDHVQHKSAWFEIMLYSWLGEIGVPTPEPEFLGNHPDFLLNVNGQEVVIEAKAVLIPESVRIQKAWVHEIQWLLNQIEELSLVVNISEVNLTSRIDAANFLEEVMPWLQNTSRSDFQYEDDQGNHINLEILWRREQGGVATAGPSGSFWIDSSKLQRPLREKAHQHKAIRKSEYPYLIAIYLEDKVYSAEEIAEAWFGRETVVVDINTATAVDQRLDMSGIHYFGREIRHRSVSGTLVFQDYYNSNERSRRLQVWYIQNPYATKPVDPTLFPVKGRFVVKGQDERRYQMGWERNPREEVET